MTDKADGLSCKLSSHNNYVPRMNGGSNTVFVCACWNPRANKKWWISPLRNPSAACNSIRGGCVVSLSMNGKCIQFHFKTTCRSGQTKHNFSRNAKTETSTPKKAKIMAEPKFWPKAAFLANNVYFGQNFHKFFLQNMSKNMNFWPKRPLWAEKVFRPNHRKWT